MKRVLASIACFLLLVGTLNAQPTRWEVDFSSSYIDFNLTRLGISRQQGRIRVFMGDIESSTKDFNNSEIGMKLVASSITTDDRTLDVEIKSPDFLDVGKYREIIFQSTSFKKITGKTYALEGNLTIKNVTKKVKFSVTCAGTVKDQAGKTLAIFRASTRISRKDFGLTWNQLTAAGTAVMGDTINISMNLEFVKQGT